MRVLILGGTTEARRLAERLAGHAGIAVTLSLAGRTAAPAPLPVPVRIGGFGGVHGLAGHLAAERIDVLVDATHPYAAQISGNAARAARIAGVKILALRRPPWRPTDGDRWTEVADTQAAVAALGETSQRVFLTLGRNELAPFTAAPWHHYLVRSVDPVDPPLAVPHAVYLTGRGPFVAEQERALLVQHRIEVLVTKNSGGSATYAKIEAARILRLPVIMLCRPTLPVVAAVEHVDEAVAWLDHAMTPETARGV